MKPLFCWSLFFWVCVGPLALGDDAADAKDDAKKMEGTWKPVSAELAGKVFPEEILKSMKLVLSDGKYTVTVGQQTDEGTVKLDTTKKPRVLDIEGTKGPNKGKKIPAIYELTEDTLRVCYDLTGKTRPTEFKTKADTMLFLVEYKRQKP
jgi:uncharacterized protein (TIGR03067 family)